MTSMKYQSIWNLLISIASWKFPWCPEQMTKIVTFEQLGTEPQLMQGCCGLLSNRRIDSICSSVSGLITSYTAEHQYAFILLLGEPLSLSSLLTNSQVARSSVPSTLCRALNPSLWNSHISSLPPIPHQLFTSKGLFVCLYTAWLDRGSECKVSDLTHYSLCHYTRDGQPLWQLGCKSNPCRWYTDTPGQATVYKQPVLLSGSALHWPSWGADRHELAGKTSKI